MERDQAGASLRGTGQDFSEEVTPRHQDLSDRDSPCQHLGTQCSRAGRQVQKPRGRNMLLFKETPRASGSKRGRRRGRRARAWGGGPELGAGLSRGAT